MLFQIATLTSSYDNFRKSYPKIGYFLVQVMPEKILLHPLKDFDNINKSGKVSVYDIKMPTNKRALASLYTVLMHSSHMFQEL